jgi:hypothetical protein
LFINENHSQLKAIKFHNVESQNEVSSVCGNLPMHHITLHTQAPGRATAHRAAENPACAVLVAVAMVRTATRFFPDDLGSIFEV